MGKVKITSGFDKNNRNGLVIPHLLFIFASHYKKFYVLREKTWIMQPMKRLSRWLTAKAGPIIIVLAVALGCQPAAGATDEEVAYEETRFDEDSGLSQAHATQILQDEDGFLWIATWNGLNRFDGYEFRRMVPQPGDGCSMQSDRIRNIWLSGSGDIYCKLEDDIFLFDRRTYRFRDLATEAEKETALEAEQQTDGRGHFNGRFFEFTDRQGLRWELRGDAVYRLRPVNRLAQPVAQQQPAQTRCLARDRQGRIWLTTREDATVRLFDARLQPLGYLRQDGRLQPGYVSFGHPVYCVTQTRDGLIWIGSKPGGLYRYDSERQELRHIDALPHNAVYDIKEDRKGRLWIATLGGGIVCKDGDTFHQFLAPLKVRYIHLTADDILIATTTEGLVVGRLGEQTGDIVFRRHLREPDRANSLGCNATMDVLEDREGRLFVSTESGGIFQIVSHNSSDLTADTLSFRPLPMRGGWPTEVALSMTDMGSGHEILITSSNLLMVYDTRQGTGSTYDAWFFHHPYRFSEVRPLQLDDGRWLFGSTEGAFTLSPQDMAHKPFVPHIALTAINIQKAAQQSYELSTMDYELAVNHLDTLLLSPTERSLTIQFAALDFANVNHIRYEFRLGGDDTPWNSIGHDHSVTLLDLRPGTYELWIRSTNADGISVDNQRRLVIIVEPTFWEAWYGQLLILLLVAATIGISMYTILYIRRIKRKQRKTLEAYLALIEKMEETDSHPSEPTAPTDLSASSDPTIQRAMDYIEANLSNSEANVGDMAAAAAISRSGLQRKLKQAMGITPLDLLREARVKHACQLLRQTDKTVGEVAYACGFTDPKYFSRSFKQSTGQTPSEYKAVHSS